MKKLKILRITTAVYPEAVGGHAVQCDEISSFQTNDGNKVILATLRRDKLSAFMNIAKGGYIVIRLKKVWMPWDSLGMCNPFIPSLFQIGKQLDFDLIHTHSHLFWSTVIAVFLAKSKNKPVITTVHGVMAKRNFFVNLAQYIYLYSFGSWVFQNSNKIICLTQADAKEIMRYAADPKKIRVLSNAVNIDSFKPGVNRSKNIVWVGRYVAEKGIKYLIDASEAVIRKHHDVQFTLVGDGPLKHSIERLVESKKLKANFKFIARTTQSDVATILKTASAFVLPSLKEGFPKTLLEAMACEIPVIVFDIPGLNEFIKNEINGLVVPIGDSSLLAQAIARICDDDSLRNRLGKKGRELVLEKYNWKIVNCKIEEIYREAIEEYSYTRRQGCIT